MDFSFKVQDLKSQSTISYWKHVLKDCQMDQTNIVKVKRNALHLAKDFERLLKLYEKQESVNDGLREKLRQLRQQKEQKEKQVQLANRTIERLTVKRGDAEAQDAAKDSYIRRLEAKVFGMRTHEELELACREMEEKIEKLEQEVKNQEARAEQAEKRNADAEKESLYLKRGIQLAAEQLTKSSGKDVSSSMLLAVAHGQEEAISLARELAEAKEKSDGMEVALKAAREHLTSQHEALMRWKEWEAAEKKAKQELQRLVEEQKEELSRLNERAATFHTALADTKKMFSECQSALEMEKTSRIEAENALRQKEMMFHSMQVRQQRASDVHDGPASIEVPEMTAGPQQSPTVSDKIDSLGLELQDIVDQESSQYEGNCGSPQCSPEGSKELIWSDNPLASETSPSKMWRDVFDDSFDRTVVDLSTSHASTHAQKPSPCLFDRQNEANQSQTYEQEKNVQPLFSQPKGCIVGSQPNGHEIKLHAYAASNLAEKRPTVRHTLFDLANMDLNDL